MSFLPQSSGIPIALQEGERCRRRSAEGSSHHLPAFKEVPTIGIPYRLPVSICSSPV